MNNKWLPVCNIFGFMRTLCLLLMFIKLFNIKPTTCFITTKMISIVFSPIPLKSSDPYTHAEGILKLQQCGTSSNQNVWLQTKPVQCWAGPTQRPVLISPTTSNRTINLTVTKTKRTLYNLYCSLCKDINW